MIQTIRVRIKDGADTRGNNLLSEIKNLGVISVTEVKTARVYRLEGVSADDASRLAPILFVEGIHQISALNAPLIADAIVVIEVAYKPGVMNPEVVSILKSSRDLGFVNLIAADSSTEYGFFGTPSTAEIQLILERLLVNKTVERIVIELPKTLLISGEPGEITVIPMRSFTDYELMELSKDKLFLNLDEMHAIQEYFNKIGRDPIDAEIETFAQTWSEHCGHKTFKSRLVVDGQEKESLIARIKRGVELFPSGVLSAFDDNSGVVEFYDGFAICGKVETHNSPSAIEPYGGAATGSGGVFRDIMGTGQGAKVIASTDIFCFAPLDLDLAKLPDGCLRPNYLLRRIIAGVRDYGNRMGIPTSNGSIHFHEDFMAKPTVLVGAYGIVPVSQCQKGKPKVGDQVVVLGGRTGRDGIHGCTFASGEMTERTLSVNASAVQIGNAIEEKRMVDAIVACRDAGLIHAITDCGAGGFASAIGEIGSELGVKVDLKKAPLKYSGLAPWEIWLSESQERMVLAVASTDVARVFDICKNLNVEATVLGEFTGDQRLMVTYGNATVCDLDMQFLHHGLLAKTLRAHWTRPVFEEARFSSPSDWVAACGKVLSHGNVCSKEPILRCYDHGVQGTNALPPLSGAAKDGPNDAVVLTPILGKPYGLIISHGLNPILNRIDPYWGSVWAAIEALANLVAVGGNPKEAWLIDNFSWPFPDEEALGALDHAVDACVDVSQTFGIPFISGKDSLASTYRGKNGVVINIPPVLCVSVIGKIPDVKKTITADFKNIGSTIMLVGSLNPSMMAGSIYYDTHGVVGNNLPQINLAEAHNVFLNLHKLIQDGRILACHDISEGGLFVTLTEMCFGGNVGALIKLPVFEVERVDFILFNEMAGCFLIEVAEEDVSAILSSGISASILGSTTEETVIDVSDSKEKLFKANLADLKTAWQKPMQDVFYG